MFMSVKQKLSLIQRIKRNISLVNLRISRIEVTNQKIAKMISIFSNLDHKICKCNLKMELMGK